MSEEIVERYELELEQRGQLEKDLKEKLPDKPSELLALALNDLDGLEEDGDMSAEQRAFLNDLVDLALKHNARVEYFDEDDTWCFCGSPDATGHAWVVDGDAVLHALALKAS